ncbi:MAG: lamin tail domain-containing protein [Gemmatimonadota bacterium]|nr:MAG: lamin tail domain-containing protein [Gemmatimonadota bacterium]
MVGIIITVTTILFLCGFCTACCDSTAVVINEIMYAPQRGEPEWIEIYNKSTVPIDLTGWTLEDADSTRPRILSLIPILIESNSYVCVTQDSSGLYAQNPDVSCPIIQPLNGWSKLNNGGDLIVLRDATGTSIDALEYDDQWGGGDGKSLERIHPDWSSQSPRTWSTCVSVSLATLCAPNSIYFSVPFRKATVWVEPDPFDTKTTISYKLTVPRALLKLEIYDIRGRLVRRLIDQELSGSAGSVIWNGTNGKGEKLRTGVYILYLEAINAEMGVLDRVKKSVVLAVKLD